MAEPLRRVRNGFVDPILVCAIECDAGAAGINQSGDLIFPARFNDVLRSDGVDLKKRLLSSPDSSHARGMKNDIASLAGVDNALCVANISLNRFDTE